MTTLERLTTVSPREEIEIKLPQIYFDFLCDRTEDFLYDCRYYQLHADEYGNLIDSNDKLRYTFNEYYGYLVFAKKEYSCLNSKNKAAYLRLKEEIKKVVKH